MIWTTIILLLAPFVVIAQTDVDSHLTLKNLRAFTVPCSAHWNECSHDQDCMECFETFTPNFTMKSFDSCDEFEASFDNSCSANCQTEKKIFKELSLCVADEVFYITTLGTVTNLCSMDDGTNNKSSVATK